MAASALNFEDGSISVHQVLAVNPKADGSSGMPRTREELLGHDVLDAALPQRELL